MNANNYRLVEVRWLDAEDHGDPGWNELKAMKRYAKKPAPIMNSVGYVLYEGPDHISLASTVSDIQCSIVEKIPKGCILNIREIKYSKV